MKTRIITVLSYLLTHVLELAYGFALGSDLDRKYLREVSRTQQGGMMFHHDLDTYQED